MVIIAQFDATDFVLIFLEVSIDSVPSIPQSFMNILFAGNQRIYLLMHKAN